MPIKNSRKTETVHQCPAGHQAVTLSATGHEDNWAACEKMGGGHAWAEAGPGDWQVPTHPGSGPCSQGPAGTPEGQGLSPSAGHGHGEPVGGWQGGECPQSAPAGALRWEPYPATSSQSKPQ